MKTEWYEENNIKWIKDDSGNKCSVNYFGSEEEAEKALLSLDNCKNCVNCAECYCCFECFECFYCTHCSHCSVLSYRFGKGENKDVEIKYYDRFHTITGAALTEGQRTQEELEQPKGDALEALETLSKIAESQFHHKREIDLEAIEEVVDLEEIIRAELTEAQRMREELDRVKACYVQPEVLNFLHGVGKLDGMSFGDGVKVCNGKCTARYWWRKHLPVAPKQGGDDK